MKSNQKEPLVEEVRPFIGAHDLKSKKVTFKQPSKSVLPWSKGPVDVKSMKESTPLLPEKSVVKTKAAPVAKISTQSQKIESKEITPLQKRSVASAKKRTYTPNPEWRNNQQASPRSSASPRSAVNRSDKPALLNSKVPPSQPLIKKREQAQQPSQSQAVQNDPSPTAKKAHSIIQTKTTVKHNASSEQSLTQLTDAPPLKNVHQANALLTISSSTHNHPTQEHDLEKVYLAQHTAPSSSEKFIGEKFEQTEPWNSGDVERPLNTRSISILSDGDSLVVVKRDKMPVFKKELSGLRKENRAMLVAKDHSQSQRDSADIGSLLDLVVANPSPVAPKTPVKKSVLLKAPVKHSKRPPVAPMKTTKQLSIVDSSMPSRITSMTSLTSLDMADAQLTLLDLLDISTTEKYKRLREAYTTQRLFRTKIEKENKQLRDHISILNKRMIKDFNVQKNSLPLENQYQKRVDIEKQKYELLVDENHRLISRLKALEDETMRKLIDKRPLEKLNELHILKSKFKESERERERLDTSLQFMTKELEAESIGSENLRNQLDYMKMHFAHLAPKAVQLFENEYMDLIDAPPKKSAKKGKLPDGTRTRQHSSEGESTKDAVKEVTIALVKEASEHSIKKDTLMEHIELKDNAIEVIAVTRDTPAIQVEEEQTVAQSSDRIDESNSSS